MLSSRLWHAPILVLCSLALVLGCESKSKPGADLVFINAIVYVGGTDGAQDFIGEATAVHDLQGELLLPGFIDTHLHPIRGDDPEG